MSRRRTHLAVLCAVLGALMLPGTAAADDADVAAAATRWSVRILEPATQLQTKITTATTPAQMLAFLRPFTSTATRGALAIDAQKPATARGARLRTLARAAFTEYASAGRLLISAVNDLKQGRGRSVVEPKIMRAIALAESGGAKLTKASKLIPGLVGG